MGKMHIRKGDTVKVLAGNYRGKTGEVLKVFPKQARAIVEGLNKVYHHLKPTTKQPKGSIVHKEAPIHISNLLSIDTNGNAARISKRHNTADKIERVSSKEEVSVK